MPDQRGLGWALLAGVLALLSSVGLQAEDRLQMARIDAGQAILSELSPQGVLRQGPLTAATRTPLGSVWKLFMHAYLLDQGMPDPGYSCSGTDREEVYCCERGETINRGQALVRSCGLYYDPLRLGVQAEGWRDYWQARKAPAWLADLARLQPATEVQVDELLAMLVSLPAQAAIRPVLLDSLLRARQGHPVGELGSRLRVKTWSWHQPDASAQRIGGFAGWLADGSPVWAGAPGTSLTVLALYAAALGQALPTAWPAEPGGCVLVTLFERYPVRAVQQSGGQLATPGRLQGTYQVIFANDNRLEIESRGELVLSRDEKGLQLTARLSREDYVARVLEREAGAEPVEAARALAIAIRSYLQQNARRVGECLVMADSSASQRVAPRPAGEAARSVAAWTADLVLAGSPVNYHRDQAGDNRLSWQLAVEQARSGLRYDLILNHAFPQASLSRWDNPATNCQTLDSAASWLKNRLAGWRPRLDDEVGYGETRDFTVCRLASGRPHVDREMRRIFVRGLHSLQDRLDLTHEYLHLAFDAHPKGQDETYIENLARRLLLE